MSRMSDVLILYIFIKLANREDPDQTPSSVESDLELACLSKSFLLGR